MDPPPNPPPSSTPAAAENNHSDQLPPVPTTTPKLRLMCSYGGHIVPRPNDKALCYAGGETRIVAVDRSTTAASLHSLTAHLSRILFNNRPFHLKYQLPSEDLDSLISVATDEDLSIMLEEYDRVSSIPSAKPSRIRLFLFPVKPESLGSALLDPKADSWFSDALKNTGNFQRGQSADSGFVNGLMGLDILSGPLEAPVDEVSNNIIKNEPEISVGGGAALPESMVLETSSSFGSTSSSVSMSNLPPIGVQSEEAEKKVRVLSSASLESEVSAGSAGSQAKPAAFQELRNQVVSGSASFTIESESSNLFDTSPTVQMQKAVQVSGYQLPQQFDGKQHQHEVQYIHGNAHFTPQYSTGPLPQAPYYPVYQMPVHQQQHSPYSINQPYPVYLVPIRPVQSYNTSMHGNINNNQTTGASRPPPHPQTATFIPPMMYKEIMTAQPTIESVPKVHCTSQPATPLVGVPSSQGQQQFMGPPEPPHSSLPVPAASIDAADYSSELDDNLVYTPIYKTQPSAPLLPSQVQITTKGAAVLMSESTMQTDMKHPAA